jgi:inosose dehydratase
MLTALTRRQFLAAGAAALAAPRLASAAGAQITIGITVDTRPDWNGADNFVRSIREASAAGYHWVETFINYVERYDKNPQELKDLLASLNLKLETVSNGGRMNTNFQDPAQRAAVVEDHMRLVRFIQQFGCDHLKINCGRPERAGNTPAVYREMSLTFNEIGRRMTDLGMKFAIHAHLDSKLENRRDVDAVLEQTDPRHVWFVLDTGHITMAGMDPVELTRTYVSRIIEYHLKDTAPENRGGYKGPHLKPGAYNTTPENVVFYELGKGGVDFPGILAILNRNNWKGWGTVELDRTTSTARQSCAITKKYIEEVLKLRV